MFRLFVFVGSGWLAGCVDATPQPDAAPAELDAPRANPELLCGPKPVTAGHVVYVPGDGTVVQERAQYERERMYLYDLEHYVVCLEDVIRDGVR